MTPPNALRRHRIAFHLALVEQGVLATTGGKASNADRGNKTSCAIALHLADQLGARGAPQKLAGQSLGSEFEKICADFLDGAFRKFLHRRPGRWDLRVLSHNKSTGLRRYEQYSHLADLEDLCANNPNIAAALGNEYLITPDIVVTRQPDPDEVLDPSGDLLDDQVARLASLRERFQPHEILHASISCKWTIRSDRAQNARAEALNLLRNRKGRSPHIVVIMGEPLPGRLASLALGTGDIDCVYHFALPELIAAVDATASDDSRDLLRVMVEGRRLKDIADLPLDLVI